MIYKANKLLNGAILLQYVNKTRLSGARKHENECSRKCWARTHTAASSTLQNQLIDVVEKRQTRERLQVPHFWGGMVPPVNVVQYEDKTEFAEEII